MVVVHVVRAHAERRGIDVGISKLVGRPVSEGFGQGMEEKSRSPELKLEPQEVKSKTTPA